MNNINSHIYIIIEPYFWFLQSAGKGRKVQKALFSFSMQNKNLQKYFQNLYRYKKFSNYEFKKRKKIW